MTELILNTIKSENDYEVKVWKRGGKLTASDVNNMSETINKTEEALSETIDTVNDFVGDVSIFDNTLSETISDIKMKVSKIGDDYLSSSDKTLLEDSIKAKANTAEVDALHKTIDNLQKQIEILKTLLSNGVTPSMTEDEIDNIKVVSLTNNASPLSVSGETVIVPSGNSDMNITVEITN